MKNLILILALAPSSAFADSVVLTHLRANTITVYAGCEINSQMVPMDPSNSVLTAVCDEQEITTYRSLRPAKHYSPFGSVAVVFQQKFEENDQCNMVAVRTDGTTTYWFQCF